MNKRIDINVYYCDEVSILDILNEDFKEFLNDYIKRYIS